MAGRLQVSLGLGLSIAELSIAEPDADQDGIAVMQNWKLSVRAK